MFPYTEDSIIADALTTFAQLVEKRDYDGAWTQWQGVKGQVDGFTYWYNLGTLQTLRGNYAEARFALEKARYLTLYSDATEQQLTTVNAKLAVETNSSSLGPMAMNAIVALGPMKLWFIVLLIALGLILGIQKSWNKLAKGGAIAAALIPMFVMAWFHSSTVSIIALKPIEVYEGPSKVFAGGRSVPAGTRVLGWREGQWIKVYGENSEALWLPWSETVLKAGWLWGNNP